MRAITAMLPVDIKYERNRRELPRRVVEYASLWVMIFEESSQSGYKQNTLLVARTPSPINILFLAISIACRGISSCVIHFSSPSFLLLIGKITVEFMNNILCFPVVIILCFMLESRPLTWRWSPSHEWPPKKDLHNYWSDQEHIGSSIGP